MNTKKPHRIDWQKTLDAIESARQGRVIEADKVHEWLNSWGTEAELNPPIVKCETEWKIYIDLLNL
ncbi:transcriptional regulator [Marinomonas ushuaiensis DSM 15871]|uniref:Transcriptional regulator n=1 Tax=Marinomonas ushuaiensis DSM 15871 TaxID=1122207 RepID=X7EAH7_9GAMM|nr:hypothetical protein [Marinomonas ushuaiensis]ETX12133.1 transcriptional regulator [Marinomonas ushuaiensis DSM 15871]